MFLLIDHKRAGKSWLYSFKQMQRKVTWKANPSHLRNRPDYPSDQVADCWIWVKPFLDELQNLDYCRYFGKLLGLAHNQCNLKQWGIYYIPLIAQSSFEYDLHLFCIKLREIDCDGNLIFFLLLTKKMLLWRFVWKSIRIQMKEVSLKSFTSFGSVLILTNFYPQRWKSWSVTCRQNVFKN